MGSSVLGDVGMNIQLVLIRNDLVGVDDFALVYVPVGFVSGMSATSGALPLTSLVWKPVAVDTSCSRMFRDAAFSRGQLFAKTLWENRNADLL